MRDIHSSVSRVDSIARTHYRGQAGDQLHPALNNLVAASANIETIMESLNTSLICDPLYRSELIKIE